jgi:hypothetical protein
MQRSLDSAITMTTSSSGVIVAVHVGSALFIAETTSRPRSLKGFGKRLIQSFHDQPLGLLGIRSRRALGALHRRATDLGSRCLERCSRREA